MAEFPISSPTIVGIMADSAVYSIRDPPLQLLYLPLAQREGPIQITNFYVAVRAGTGSPAALTRDLTALLTAFNPDLALRFQPLAAQTRAALARDELIAILSGFFSGLALVIAALGLYGVTAYSVSRRRGEIGIRMALGADAHHVIWLVLGRTLSLIGVGVLFGGVATIWSSRFIASLLPRPIVFADHSYRAAPTPWTQHLDTVFVAGVVLFGIVALLQRLVSDSETSSGVAIQHGIVLR